MGEGQKDTALQAGIPSDGERNSQTPLDKYGKEKKKKWGSFLFISNWLGLVASCEHIKQRFYVQI